ncbi:MAG: signal peptidase I [Patescibacteria group bacterium]|nr:signal peptidase I [Patescibacteria group bacterium]MBU1870825.1 signal peptidase I [Patescibacteria group bacterium]
MIKSFLGFIFELIKIVVISLVIIVPIRYFLIQPFYVKGASMEPNFYDHDYLIVDEISFRFNQPKRGDIVVFKYPRNQQEYFIKRLIGLPNEKIQIKDGEVYIFNQENLLGKKIEEVYLNSNAKTYNLNNETVSLANDEYYVLGDNRNFSKDSRSFGAVKKNLIVGRVLLRGWPFNKINLFLVPQYNY